MAKINSIVNAVDLKKVFNKLPVNTGNQTGDEFELRFRAVLGKRKGEKEDSAGLFIGPLMLKAFTTEEAKFVSSQVFAGVVQPSKFKPGERVLLITKSAPGPLRTLAKACLKQAKIPYQVVVLKPGESEPQDVLDDDDQDGNLPPENMGGEIPPKQPPEMLISKEMDKQLALAFPPGGAAKIKGVTSKFLSGTGENFTPVLVALERVEKERTSDNLSDLRSAAMAYLKHVEKSYSEKDRKDPVNQEKIKTALHALRELEKAQKGVKPLNESVKDIWATQFEKVKKLVVQAKQLLGDTPYVIRQIELLKQAGEVAQKGDSVAALNLIKDMPKTLELVPAYVQALEKVQQNLTQLEKANIPGQALGLLKERLEKARTLGQAGQITEAMKMLSDFNTQQKMVLEKISSLKKDDSPVQQSKEVQGEQAVQKHMQETGERLKQLVESLGKDDQRVKGILEKFAEAKRVFTGYAMPEKAPQKEKEDAKSDKYTGKVSEERDMVKANALLSSIDRMISETTQESKMTQEQRDEQECIALRNIVDKRMKLWTMDAEDEGSSSSIKNNLADIKQQYETAINSVNNGDFSNGSLLFQKILKSKVKKDTEEVVNNFIKRNDIPEKKKKPIESLLKIAMQSEDKSPFHEVLSNYENLMTLTHGTLENIEWENTIDESNYSIPNEMLDQGGFGSTYILKGKKDNSPDLVFKMANEEATESSLHHEEEIYKSIGYHPNIARCLGVKKIDGKSGLLMEAIKGGNVKQFTETLQKGLQTGEISYEEYIGVTQFTIKKTLHAIDHMNKLGFVHQDIKPENVMFDKENGEVKLIDMGISVKTGEQRISYSPGKSSPEQVAGKVGMDVKSDVYTIGMLLQLFNSSSYKSKINNTPLKDFVDRMTEKDPEKRPSIAQALEHPFLKEMLVDEDKVKEVIKKGNDQQLIFNGLYGFKKEWGKNFSKIESLGLPSTINEDFKKIDPAINKILQLITNASKEFQSINEEVLDETFMTSNSDITNENEKLWEKVKQNTANWPTFKDNNEFTNDLQKLVDLKSRLEMKFTQKSILDNLETITYPKVESISDEIISLLNEYGKSSNKETILDGIKEITKNLQKTNQKITFEDANDSDIEIDTSDIENPLSDINEELNTHEEIAFTEVMLEFNEFLVKRKKLTLHIEKLGDQYEELNVQFEDFSDQFEKLYKNNYKGTAALNGFASASNLIHQLTNGQPFISATSTDGIYIAKHFMPSIISESRKCMALVQQIKNTYISHIRNESNKSAMQGYEQTNLIGFLDSINNKLGSLLENDAYFAINQAIEIKRI